VGEKAPTVLTLEVSLPDPLKVTPSELEWKKDKTPAAKDVQISALPGVEIVEAESTLPFFEIKTRKIHEGAWMVSILPKTSDSPATALLRVRFSGDASGAVSIPLRIR
jgi:hypothetical protein